MSQATVPPRPSPQLYMCRQGLADLPGVTLPPGYSLRHYQPGDHAHWDRIIGESFKMAEPSGSFDRMMRPDAAFRPERVYFICQGALPVATASAWNKPAGGPRQGYLHYVGTVPAATGQRLGYWVSLACLHHLAGEGREEIILQTDDFRLPAIKTYLRLGFAPLIIHENQSARWLAVFATLGQPELGQTFAEALAAAPWSAPEDRVDLAKVETFEPRRRWLPQRQHRGGTVGGGDLDWLGDETLYRASRLGRATLTPTVVPAGAPVTNALVLRYEVGTGGLGVGAALRFGMRGQGPLGFSPQGQDPAKPAYLQLSGPPHAQLKPSWMGFEVASGALAPGDRVTLTLTNLADLRWTKLAGRKEFKVVILPGGGEPQQRLPAPLVLTVQPGPATRLEVLLPATQRPGAAPTVNLTVRDAFDNPVAFAGPVRLRAGQQRLTAYLSAGHGQAILPPGLPDHGPLVVSASQPTLGLKARSNPCVTQPGLQYFVGDLHCHDFLSQAEGYPDAVYAWARDEKRLDFVSIIPQSHGWHDNETWDTCRYHAERYLAEGRFVPLLGFEWQHSGYGDKVIHYLTGDQPYLPVDDPRYRQPAKLYEALRQSDALIISHHPGHPLPAWVPGTDYSLLETDVERLIEIWSMHGSSEGYDPTDRPLRQPHRLVLPALQAGLRVGFVGGSDTHGGRPGGSAKEPLGYWGGLAAVWAEDLTREGLFRALHARRTVALTQARIIVKFMVNDQWQGSELPLAKRAELSLEVWAPSPIAKVEILRQGVLWQTRQCRADHCRWELSDQPTAPVFYHCRVTLADGNLAVCSPIWLG